VPGLARVGLEKALRDDMPAPYSQDLRELAQEI
jgi:hypothetical protein